MPTREPFVYNRQNPPFFFSTMQPEDKESWDASLTNMTREYFKMSRKYKIGCGTPLSNGMTAGEYSMFLLLSNHEKRNQEKLSLEKTL